MFGAGAGIDDSGSVGSVFAPLPNALIQLTPHSNIICVMILSIVPYALVFLFVLV